MCKSCTVLSYTPVFLVSSLETLEQVFQYVEFQGLKVEYLQFRPPQVCQPFHFHQLWNFLHVKN